MRGVRGHRSVEGRGVAQMQSWAGHRRIAQRLVSGALGGREIRTVGRGSGFAKNLEYWEGCGRDQIIVLKGYLGTNLNH